MVGGALAKPPHLERLFKDIPGGQWLRVERRPGRAPSEGLPTTHSPQVLHSPPCCAATTPVILAAYFPGSLGKQSSLQRRRGGDFADREMAWEARAAGEGLSVLGNQCHQEEQDKASCFKTQVRVTSSRQPSWPPLMRLGIFLFPLPYLALPLSSYSVSLIQACSGPGLPISARCWEYAPHRGVGSQVCLPEL